MSQHLITQFINRTYVFKPFSDVKIANKKLKKYQSSNRNNNSSPEDIAESTHSLQKIKVCHETQSSKKTKTHGTIDITI